MGKIFGIDLGTTYSCIAYVDEYGKPETVPNIENSPVTPSVVFFESPDSISVGETAKRAIESDPLLVCSTIKRMMGSKEYSFTANGKQYKPETISSMILRKLADDASLKLGEAVTDVVITCPAYFGADEREATKKAGQLAKLNVVSIIDEPVAAAISYGMKVNEPQTVIVYDLGGGTFDVTVIQVSEGHIEVIATGGDHKLGGKDWDGRIQKYVVDQYVQLTGESEETLYEDEAVIGDLEVKSEEAKKQLSSRQNVKIRLLSQNIELSREQFNTITVDLLQNTISMMRDTMDQAAKKGITNYDKILLVGGSTFMPQVKEILEKEFPATPIEYCNPNESVARGAALYGANKQAYDAAIKKMIEEKLISPDEIDNHKKIDEILKEKGNQFHLPGGQTPIKPTIIHNVLSKSIGCQFQNPETGELKIYNLIFRNTKLPFDRCITCSTVTANQSKVQLSLFENKYYEGHNPDDSVDDADAKLLADGYLEPLPPNLPADSPIELKIKVDNEGMLSVDATDISRPNGVTVNIKVQLNDAMSQEEFEEATHQLEGLKRI